MEDLSRSEQDAAIPLERAGSRSLLLAFFAVTLVFLASRLSFLLLRDSFSRISRLTNLSGCSRSLIQALMDLVLVGFIFFLIKKLHRTADSETLHWIRTENMPVGRLIAARRVSLPLPCCSFPRSSHRHPIHRWKNC